MSNTMMIDNDFVDHNLGFQPVFENDQVVDFIDIGVGDTNQEDTINEDEIDNINTEDLLDMLGD